MCVENAGTLSSSERRRLSSGVVANPAKLRGATLRTRRLLATNPREAAPSLCRLLCAPTVRGDALEGRRLSARDKTAKKATDSGRVPKDSSSADTCFIVCPFVASQQLHGSGLRVGRDVGARVTQPRLLGRRHFGAPPLSLTLLTHSFGGSQL